MSRRKDIRLREKVAFDQRNGVPDGSGGEVMAWVLGYSCHAEFIYSRGSEAVDAARLEGRSVFKIRIRQSAGARLIETDWRMRDLRRGPQTGPLSGEEYNIREVDAITDRKWVFLVVESGVAV
ncbi:head-tail adaptor protein [Pseudophaeobacter sp.]|uniref:phage head completion protein n=1 Tax=Pseudophaeobacter sp. TaxID=1971739 RepID=UPI003A982387